MAEMTAADPGATSSCCSAETQATCCEPSEKADCCATATVGGSCGCSASHTEMEIRETHRVDEHPTSAIIRARTPTNAPGDGDRPVRLPA
jgi:arsenite methyltransferase